MDLSGCVSGIFWVSKPHTLQSTVIQGIFLTGLGDSGIQIARRKHRITLSTYVELKGSGRGQGLLLLQGKHVCECP